jgi:hypothetical protein
MHNCSLQVIQSKSQVHTTLPWPIWWCAAHKYWTFCCAARYFQSRTQYKISSTRSKSQCKKLLNQYTDSTSAEDTANESGDLPDLDTEDKEVLEEEGVFGEEEEEKEEEEERNEEGNEEDEPVSNDDMEHSVIVVASGPPRGIRL